MVRSLTRWWMVGILACGWIGHSGPALAVGAVLEYAYEGSVVAEQDSSEQDAVQKDTNEQDSVAHDISDAGMRLDIEGDKILVSFQRLDDVGEQSSATATFDLPRRLLYLGEHQLLVLLDDEKKTYSQIDREVLAVLDRHLDQEDTNLRLRLIQLPEQPRRVMADVLAAEDAERASRRPWLPWQVESSGTWDAHQGYRSLKYDVKAGNEELGELWVTEVDQTELDPKVIVYLRNASLVLDQLLVAASEMTFANSLEVFGFEANPLAAFAFQRGVPVLIRRLEGSEVKYEKILQSIRPRHQDDEPVGIPKGYRPVILSPQ